jgi:hypothetical protein
LVGDALITERRQKPVKDCRCVAVGDGLVDTRATDLSSNVFEKSHGTGEGADALD